jgi:Ca-activated chloride channel homolog
MLEFAWRWAFLLLPLPLLAWLLLPPYRERRASVQVPFFERLAAATGQTPQRGAVMLRRRAMQMLVAALAWVLTVVALARPQWVGEPVRHQTSARDLILAVDVSGSMDQNDFRAADGRTLKRLDGVEHVLADFIGRRHGDRVGLILFGSKAYVQVPFTQDLATAQQLLDQAQVGMAGQQTVIGDAIGLAVKTFEASKAQQKLLLLLTDGNDQPSTPRACRRHRQAKRGGRLHHRGRRPERIRRRSRRSRRPPNGGAVNRRPLLPGRGWRSA